MDSSGMSTEVWCDFFRRTMFSLRKQTEHVHKETREGKDILGNVGCVRATARL